MEPGEGLLSGVEVVEFSKFVIDGGKMVIELVLAYDFVGHGDSEGLHGMTIGVMESADHFVEVVNTVFLELHLYYAP